MNHIKGVTSLVIAAMLVMGLLASSLALAHNAGHVHLPNGTCVDVGSGKHGPTVNPAAPSIANPDGSHTLDLIPGPGDQYGARFAATRGNTPIHARHCDEPGAHNHP